MRKDSWHIEPTKRIDPDIYEHVPSSDRFEMAENRKFSQSMQLLEKIEEDLDPTDFTLSEIRENFNSYVPIQSDPNSGVEVVRYGRSHINTLLEKGFIEEIEKGHYAIVRSRDI